MADHVTLSTSDGLGSVIATDEDGSGYNYQVVKLAYGALNTFNMVTSTATNPFPVALSDTDNAVLDAIAASLVTIDVDTGAIATDAAAIEVLLGTIDADTSAMVTDLAAIEVLLGTIDSDTGAIKTAVQLLDNAVDGTYLNCNSNIAGTDIVGGAGAVASGVQRVTLASDDPAVALLTTIDAWSETEDAISAVNPTGIMMMGLRDDEVGATQVTSADGDVSAMRTDKFGALKTTQLADATSNIKYAIIDAATGDTEVVATAGAGVKIRVLSVTLVPAAAATARFESTGGGTALTGLMDLAANALFVLPFNPGGWFETLDNGPLSLELSASTADGCISYVEV